MSKLFESILRENADKWWKDIPFDKWSGKMCDEWVDYVWNADDPNKSRRLPTGTGHMDSYLTPRGAHSYSGAYPQSIARMLKKFDYDDNDIIKILNKVYISLDIDERGLAFALR